MEYPLSNNMICINCGDNFHYCSSCGAGEPGELDVCSTECKNIVYPPNFPYAYSYGWSCVSDTEEKEDGIYACDHCYDEYIELKSYYAEKIKSK